MIGLHHGSMLMLFQHSFRTDKWPPVASDSAILGVQWELSWQ
jgi:hypothetical protein